MTKAGISIPPITSIETALRIYYTYSELGNTEIVALFGRLSSATIVKLKKLVKAEMDKRDMYAYGLHKINTTVAYTVWGIDVTDLERRLKKLKTLELQ
jgi:hypothetical protein